MYFLLNSIMFNCGLIYNQIKSFSFIIFIITFILLFSKSTINLLPLNILVFIGSIFLFHFYPNYYKIIKEKYPKYKISLFIFDITIHYIPLLVSYNMSKSINISYHLSFIILLVYLIIFNSKICDIYFNFEKFLMK
jgi:hypothetical protein